MHLPTSSLLTILAATSTVQGMGILSDIKNLFTPSKTAVKRDEDTCSVWSSIATTLTEQFSADGQCTDAARAAIRASFHDCFNGACDGSLILAGECERAENRALQRLCTNLGNLAKQADVGVADLIQFAAAHAIKTCPGGPTVPVKIGRVDSSEPNDAGVLPTGKESASFLISLFAQKGFSAVDLTALVGAHTAAKQRVTDPSKAGAALDTTPGTWDNNFYSETTRRRAPFSLDSDVNLSQDLVTLVPWRSFSVSQSAWSNAFVPAMTKMSMMGVSNDGLIDCTSALPGGTTPPDGAISDLLRSVFDWIH